MDRRPILLIEHDSDDAILTRRAIEKSPTSAPIVVARDAVEALDYLFGNDRNRPLPRLVLLDLRLPEIDGLEILRRLRSEDRTRLLPVIVLANAEEERDVVASYGLGANSYVRKPLRFAQFSKALGQLVAYWLHVNATPPDLTSS